MFLTPKTSGAIATGRREKFDHSSVEEAKASFAQNPRRMYLEALIYVDGAPAWVGTADETGEVDWQAWAL